MAKRTIMDKIFGIEKQNKKSDNFFKSIPQDNTIKKEKDVPIKQENIEIHNMLAKNWIEEEEEEGELLVDVYQDDSSVIIRSTVAGVKPEDLDIDINNDMITIRGKRTDVESIQGEDYFYQECYWGSFSRSIILPCEVQASKVKATLKDGVLVITLPKSQKDRSVKISVDLS